MLMLNQAPIASVMGAFLSGHYHSPFLKKGFGSKWRILIFETMLSNFYQ